MPSNFTPQTTSSALAAANAQQRYGFIQNLGTVPLYICFGSGASATNFNIVLAACATASDGTGGTTSFDNYLGVVSVFTTSGVYNYIAWWN